MNTDAAIHRLTKVIRRKHLALATGRSYRAWLTRYCGCLKGLPFHLPSEQKLERLRTDLAKKCIAPTTQNQAFNATIFILQPVFPGSPGPNSSLGRTPGSRWGKCYFGQVPPERG